MFCSLKGRALQTQTLATLYTIALCNLVWPYSQAQSIPEEVADIQQYVFAGYRWNKTDLVFESENLKSVRDIYLDIDAISIMLYYYIFCIILPIIIIAGLLVITCTYFYLRFLRRRRQATYMQAQSGGDDELSLNAKFTFAFEDFSCLLHNYFPNITFILRYIFYELMQLSMRNFISFIFNPTGLALVLVLNLYCITSHSFVSLLSLSLFVFITYYYYYQIKALKEVASVMTKHQSLEVFGLPQPFVKLIMNIYFFYNNVKDSSDSHVWLRNCAQFLMSYHDVMQVNVILSSIFSLQLESQSAEDYLRKAEDAIENWSSLRESELSIKTNRVYRALIFAGCIGASGQKFSSDGMKELLSASANSKHKFTSTEDMVFSITQLVVLYLRAGYECFVDKSMRPLYIKNRSVRTLIADHDKLLDKYATLPVTTEDITHELLEQSREFVARAAMLLKLEPSLISIMRRTIMEKYVRLLKEHNVSSIRKPPFSVMLFGGPGIGKSYLTQRIAHHYGKIVNKYGYHKLADYDPFKNVYTYNATDEYFSGYKGAEQWCMVLDDLGRETELMVRSGKTNYLNDLFTIVNVVGIATNQAALEDKGVIPLIPKLVVATTNTKDLHAHLGVSEPTALLRRLPYVIQPILKEGFKKKGSETMKQVSHTVDEAWVFNIETYKIRKDSRGGLVGYYEKLKPWNDKEYCSMSQMFEFLTERIKEHEENSNVMMDGIKNRQMYDICPHDIPKCHECRKCASMNSQSLSDWVPSWNSPPTTLSFKQRSMYRMVDYAYHYRRDLLDKLLGYFLQFEDGRSAIKAFYLDNLDRQCPGLCQRVRRMSIVFGTCIGVYTAHKAIASLFSLFKKGGHDMESQGNFWFKPDKVEFKPPEMLKPGNYEELLSSIRKSFFRLKIQADGYTPRHMQAFCLSDGRYLTVAHPFDEGEFWECEADFCSSKCRVTSVQKFVLRREQCSFLPNDLCVFRACLLPRKHLLKFLPEVIDKQARSCIIVGMRADGQLSSQFCETIRYDNVRYNHNDRMLNSLAMIGHTNDRPTSKGMCGSVYLAKIRDGYYITGIHIAGNPSTRDCASSQISQQIFLNVNKGMLAMSEVGDSLSFSKGNASSGALGPASHKGVHQWCDSFGVLKGSFPHGVTPKSNVVKTDICEEVCKLMHYVLPFGAPVMQPFQRDGIWYNPYTLACDVQGQVSPFFESGDIQYVADAMIAETTIDHSWLTDVNNVSMNVAINGIPGNTYINSLPMSTSGGFLYPGAKRKYFVGEVGDYSLEPRLLEDYYYMKEEFSKNKTIGVMFNGTLKDEPRKIKKIISGETRVFTASDVIFSIVVREQYLDICSRIQQNNFMSECAVSMNHGTQWKDVYEYVCKFGDDRIIAGDYKNYDKRMPAVFIRAAFYVLDAWRSVTRPLDVASRNISRAIATELSFPNTSLNRDVIQFFGGNSSGHPLTAILNSIANSLFMRFAYWKLGFDPITFKRHVSLLTLGDDNIMGSSLNDFNHVNISKVLGQHSVIYTMAQKEAKSVPFIHISEADFLKRRFREVKGVIMGPIEEDSIMKSLCLWQDKGNISQPERLSQCYLDARREWALHGKHVFEEKCAIMENIFDMSEYQNVRLFFIQRHKYDWSTTVDWIRGELSSDDGDDDLIHKVGVSMEAQSSAIGDSFEKEFGAYGSNNLQQISRRSGTQHFLLGVVVNPSQHSEYSSLCSVLNISRNFVACMAYSVMDFLYDTKMVVNHQPRTNFSSHWEAQAESSASTTENIHAPSAMNTHDLTVDSPKILNLGESHDADIQNFFSRKIKLRQYTWAVGTHIAEGFNVWSVMFQDENLRKKLDNYNLVKGKLMITMYINGTPFHSGMVLASYRYLSVFNDVFDATSRTHLVTRSQRPHVFLNASTCKSGCLCIPFFWPNNYFGSKDPLESRNRYGDLNLDSFDVLRQLSSGAEPIEITVFGQIVDAIVTGPTPGLFAQSLEAQSDEYSGDGPVSAPAVAVANVAAALESVPIIAPFATATKIGATAIGAIARLFGFSKPIQIEPIIRVKNNPVSSIALVDDFDTSQKLTLTSKAELSVDPRLVELEPHDVMSYKYLTQKESFLGLLTWFPNASSGVVIGTLQVDPMAEQRTDVAGVATIVPTSLSYVSRPMRAWSGTLRYRIQVIGTQYHRGRIGIVYSPEHQIGATQEVFNNTFNMIIDLSEGRDFAFEVNWQQPEPYKLLNKDNTFDDFLIEERVPPIDTANGALYFVVVNRLSVPDASTPIKLMVSVSAGDDFEVANPTGSSNEVYVWEAQSAVEELPKDENEPEAATYDKMTTGVSDNQRNKNLVHYGETILSARQLVKRYCFVRRVVHEITDPFNINTYTFFMNAMPPEPGYDPQGFDRDIASNTFTYSAVPNLLYFKRMFAGWKGAIRWKIVPISKIQHISVTRHATSVSPTFRPALGTTIQTGQPPSLTALEGLFANISTPAGTAITQNRTIDALEFEVPFKSRFKFSRAAKNYASSLDNTETNFWPGGQAVNIRVIPERGENFLAFELYAAAGEDYQFMGFLGAPVVYSYTFPAAGPT